MKKIFDLLLQKFTIYPEGVNKLDEDFVKRLSEENPENWEQLYRALQNACVTSAEFNNLKTKYLRKVYSTSEELSQYP